MENRIEEIISAVTSNPELLEKISSTLKENEGDITKSLGDVVSLISKEASKENNENSSERENDDNKGVDEIKEESTEAWNERKGHEDEEKSAFNSNQFFDLLSSLGKGTGGAGTYISAIGKGLNRCIPLLIALKPYLSHSRCELIDTLVKISKLTSIVNLAR